MGSGPTFQSNYCNKISPFSTKIFHFQLKSPSELFSKVQTFSFNKKKIQWSHAGPCSNTTEKSQINQRNWINKSSQTFHSDWIKNLFLKDFFACAFQLKIREREKLLSANKEFQLKALIRCNVPWFFQYRKMENTAIFSRLSARVTLKLFCLQNRINNYV